MQHKTCLGRWVEKVCRAAEKLLMCRSFLCVKSFLCKRTCVSSFCVQKLKARAKGAQKCDQKPRSREAEKPDTSREAEKPRSREAAKYDTSREAETAEKPRSPAQAEKPRSREAEKPPDKPRSREATGQAETVALEPPLNTMLHLHHHKTSTPQPPLNNTLHLETSAPLPPLNICCIFEDQASDPL